MGDRTIIPIENPDTQALLDKVSAVEFSAMESYKRNKINGSLSDVQNADRLATVASDIANCLVVACDGFDATSTGQISKMVIDLVYGDISQINLQDAAAIMRQLSTELMFRMKAVLPAEQSPRYLTPEQNVQDLSALFHSNFARATADQTPAETPYIATPMGGRHEPPR